MAVRRLDPEQIIQTVDLLAHRVKERFPEAGLNQVCVELLEIARQARQRSIAISQPMYGVRVVSATVIALIIAAFLFVMQTIRIPDSPVQAGEFVQILDAAFNALVLIGATILFLVTLETRVKRARALKAIHELRSLAHIIDMHQLTKDPERTVWRGRDTRSSPRRTMTRFELNRYLDYCGEMLSLSGKIAALYVENFSDSQAVAAVNDLENLTSGLARKVWQKIMILQKVSGPELPPTVEETKSVPTDSPSVGRARSVAAHGAGIPIPPDES